MFPGGLWASPGVQESFFNFFDFLKIFYFLGPSRVDFRVLLASSFRLVVSRALGTLSEPSYGPFSFLGVFRKLDGRFNVFLKFLAMVIGNGNRQWQ